jgi:drug/metabolite transporter (DMT)-like permease
MIVLGWMFERPNVSALSAFGFADLVYMTLVPMGVCYLAWFAALKRLPAATAAMGTLTVPILGVAAGAVFLGDPIGWRELTAGILTLTGVGLALQSKRAG